MAGERRAAEKQKGLGGIDAKAPYLNQKEVMRQCRRHQFSHVVEAPISAETPTGAKIRATEAERTLQFHYPAFGSAFQGDSRRDLPQLPDRNEDTCQVSRWTFALSLRSVRQDIQ